MHTTIWRRVRTSSACAYSLRRTAARCDAASAELASDLRLRSGELPQEENEYPCHSAIRYQAANGKNERSNPCGEKQNEYCGENRGIDCGGLPLDSCGNLFDQKHLLARIDLMQSDLNDFVLHSLNRTTDEGGLDGQLAMSAID